MEGFIGIAMVLLVIAASMQPPLASAAAINRPLYPAYKKVFADAKDVIPDTKNINDVLLDIYNVLQDAKNIHDALTRRGRRGCPRRGHGQMCGGK